MFWFGGHQGMKCSLLKHWSPIFPNFQDASRTNLIFRLHLRLFNTFQYSGWFSDCFNVEATASRLQLWEIEQMKFIPQLNLQRHFSIKAKRTISNEIWNCIYYYFQLSRRAIGSCLSTRRSGDGTRNPYKMVQVAAEALQLPCR